MVTAIGDLGDGNTLLSAKIRLVGGADRANGARACRGLIRDRRHGDLPSAFTGAAPLSGDLGMPGLGARAMMRAMSEGAKSAAPAATNGASDASGPRLRRLEIKKFRNVRPTVLTFDDSWNVLLGKNGTGKTTLLELIATTIRGDVKTFEDVDYEIEADLSLGPARVEWKVGSSEPGSGLPADVEAGLSGAIVRSKQRRFTAAFSGDGLRSYTMTGDERGLDRFPRMRANSSAGGSAPFLLMLVMGHGDGLLSELPSHRAVDAAVASGDVQRFDEILTFFQRLSPNGDLMISSDGHENVLASAELVRALRGSMGSAEDRLSVSHENLPFLGKFVQLTGLASASLHLELVQRRASEKTPQASFGRPSFLFRRKNGEELREQHLSFGQKRLLAFLYYLTISNPVIADELVDGLHFDWISACVTEAQSRQKFFASQSPLLVDHMGFKTREAVKSRFIRCTLEGDDMVWSNFTDEEADDFFVAYRTGAQAVSEILRQKGLW